MGFLDALSGIFSSGSGASAGGYTGANPFLVALGGLASRFRATPNPGASRGDIERANRINLLAGLVGAGVNAYGAYSDNQGKQQALQGLFDIYKQGGTRQQGPMPDGSAMPKLGLAESIFAWGAQNPGLSDQAMQLGLQASQQDIANRRYDQERAFQQQQFEQRQSEFDRQLAETSRMHNASIAQQQAQLGLGYAQLNAANQRASMSAQDAQQRALLQAVEGADPSVKAQIRAGQMFAPNPNYVPPTAPKVPGVSAPEVLDGTAQQQPEYRNLYAEALKQSDERAQSERERPYINDAIGRLSGDVRAQGYTNLLDKTYNVINQNLDAGNRAAQIEAVRLLNTMADASVVNAGDMDRAMKALFTNAAQSAIEAKSWLGAQTTLTPTQIAQLKQINNIYASGVQNALKNRLETERQQLGSLGVRPERLTLFSEYLGRNYDTSLGGGATPVDAPPPPAIQDLTPGTQLPNGFTFLGF